MAEQSSTVAVFRALVMVVCLVIILVAAFCGGSFPAVVKAIQSGRCPTLADFRGPSGPASSQATEAPRFRAPAAGQAQPTDSNPGSVFAGSFPDLQGGTTRSPVVAANYNAPLASTPRVEAGALAGFPQQGQGASRQLLPLPSGQGNPLLLDHAPPPVGGSSSNDRATQILDRLKKLGATHFLLETYGDEICEFRFYCRMASGGNPRVTKHFWFSDTDPLKAMTQVLKQVEDWQAGGG